MAVVHEVALARSSAPTPSCLSAAWRGVRRARSRRSAPSRGGALCLLQPGRLRVLACSTPLFVRASPTSMSSKVDPLRDLDPIRTL